MLTLRHRLRWIGWGLIGLLALGLIGATAWAGFRVGERSVRATFSAQEAKETRILALILAKNPGATIRDFSGFPAALLAIADAFALDYRVLFAMIDKESQFQPRAVGRDGEIGLMQILPSTADRVIATYKWGGYTPPVVARAGGYASLGSLGDPAWNIRIGAAYLAIQVARFGQLDATALRAYNRHPSRAHEYRPADRYAEDVSFRVVRLLYDLPN